MVEGAPTGLRCKIEWYLYLKPPFGGPEAVLAYLSRYTRFNENGVTFR